MALSRYLLAVVAASSVAFPAIADQSPTPPAPVDARMLPYLTGRYLLAMCQSPPSSLKMASCQAYIAGTVDHQEWVERALSTKYPNLGHAWCRHKQISLGDAAPLVVKYMSMKPESLNYTASAVVWDTFHANFPCDR
jgi:hypothetical protein